MTPVLPKNNGLDASFGRAVFCGESSVGALGGFFATTLQGCVLCANSGDLFSRMCRVADSLAILSGAVLVLVGVKPDISQYRTSCIAVPQWLMWTAGMMPRGDSLAQFERSPCGSRRHCPVSAASFSERSMFATATSYRIEIWWRGSCLSFT